MFANLIALLVAIGFFNACRTGVVGSDVKDAPSVNRTQLPAGVYALQGLQSSLSYEDLKPLANDLKGASVIGLGEARHTSGGFHKANVRVIKHLIETQGFRAITLETNWGWSLPLTDYVASGTGNVLTAIDTIFPQFKSQEFMDLISWVRAFNRSHPNDTVTFFGFDMQQPDVDASRLVAFLRNTNTPALDPCIVQSANKPPGPTNQTEFNNCLDALKVIDKYLLDHQSDLVKRWSQKQFELAQVSVIGLRASAIGVFKGGEETLDARDSAMATIFSRLRHTLANDKKTIIWAHSGHVMKRVEKTTSPFVDKNMGSFLADHYGTKYKTIAMTAYTTQIAPWWRGEGLPLPSKPTSLEGMLQDLGQEVLYASGVNGIVAKGKTYEFSHFIGIPAEQFDGFIFMKTSEPMTPIPGITYPTAPISIPCQQGPKGGDVYTYTSWKCNGKDILATAQAAGIACLQQTIPAKDSIGKAISQFSSGCKVSQATTIGRPSATTIAITLGEISCGSGCSPNECEAEPAPTPAEVDNYAYDLSGNVLKLTGSVRANNIGNGGLYDLVGCLAGETEVIEATRP